MKTYYWKQKPNFGDLLTTLLLKRFSNIDAQWSPAAESEIIVVGSILEHLPKDWNGIIAGAGKLHEKTVVDFPNATILGLRGPLTAKGLSGSFVLADPGLLADEIVPMEEKEWDLGIIPHWTDKGLEFNKQFYSSRWTTKVIRVSDDPIKTISEIGRCRKIVSSSLHGIVLADAFGIPRRIEIPPLAISKPSQEGGLYKWLDYSASIGMKLVTGLTQEADRNKIVELQHELFDMFGDIEDIFNYSSRHKTA